MKYSDSVIYLDNHLLIGVKPAGLLTQPDDTGNDSFQEQLKAFLKEKEKKTGNVFLHPIHRLDRATSGLVLFARTSKALSRLNSAMREQAIERIYVAEVEGRLQGPMGRLDHYLVHDQHRAIIANKGDKEAKKARAFYQVLLHKAQTTIVQVQLETGRYHQIRAQMSAIGHPIVGDGRYGAINKKDQIHLHCTKIAFQHPVTKELIAINSPPPF